MPQRKLELYFATSSKPYNHNAKTFLHLPYRVRRQIYVLAGLVRFCPIDLNQEGMRLEDIDLKDINNHCFYQSRKFTGKYYGIDSGVPCKCPRLPSSLLYASRAISNEVTYILYSENKFTINYRGARGLRPLRNLSRQALQALQSLTIRLNNCSCIYGFSWYTESIIRPCHTLCEEHALHDRPISNSARQDISLLQEWTTLIERFTAEIHTGRLKLSLVCDVKNPETAHHVIAPLNNIPRLKDCAIRLGKSPDWEIHSLARESVTCVTGQSLLKNSTAYNYHLPEEIIEHILSFTDLVAPFELEWCFDKGLVPFDCCKTCTETLDCCCCSFYHAAFSSSCTCWRLPVSFFLVNRTFRRIATSIFYSQNYFTLISPARHERWLPRRNLSHAPAVVIRKFLESVPQGALPFIRYLRLDFSEGFEHLSMIRLEPTVTARKWEDLSEPWETDVKCEGLGQLLDEEGTGSYLLPLPRDIENSFYASSGLFGSIRAIPGLHTVFGYARVFVRSEEQDLPGYCKTILKEIVVGLNHRVIGEWKFIRRERDTWYDGFSREGPVFSPGGYEIWPAPSSFD